MKHKKRELDSITPDFTLSSEDIADLKRIMTDKEYAKECSKQLEQERDVYYEELNQMILTGKDSNGEIIPKHILEKLKKKYKRYEETKEEWKSIYGTN